MAKLNWLEITKEDVEKAISVFLEENPEYPEPRSTFLLYKGNKLPAKHIRGMAYKVHYGVEISKNDFSGGMETVRFFERLGFDMEYHGTTKVSEKTKKQMKNKKENPVVEKKDDDKVIKSVKQEEKREKKDFDDKKISITSKKVIEQKNALQLILNKMFDGDIVSEKTYKWLKTPSTISGPYEKLYNALSAYRGDTTFAKKNVTLRCDFVCESQKIIIEYDERQHFSEARRVSLEAYKEIPVMYDRDLWIKACADINAKDNTPANRDEVRAYYDSTRDIACYQNGYKLIRIMHGQIDFEKPGATEKLRELILGKEGKTEQEDKPTEKSDIIKVAMYLQTDEKKNKRAFDQIFPVMKSSDVDIIVFPEFCYVPFVNELTSIDLCNGDGDLDKVFHLCLEFSRELTISVRGVMVAKLLNLYMKAWIGQRLLKCPVTTKRSSSF